MNIFSLAKMNLTADRVSLRDEASIGLGDKIVLHPALDLELTPSAYDLRILTGGPTRNKQEGYYSDLGAYVNCDIRPIQSLLLVPGVRYDYYTEISAGLPSYRLTGRWNWRPNHTVKAAIGTYNQTPQPMGQVTDNHWGNPNLPPTTARHYVAGYEYQITDLLSLDLQGYFNQQSDIPMTTDSVNWQTQKLYNFLPLQKGRMYGLEVMLRHDPGERFFGWVAYTFSRSERQSPIPYDLQHFDKYTWDPAFWYLFESDQTHNLQVVGSWRLPKGFEAGFRLRYVTGNPLTPRLGYMANTYKFNAEEMRYVTLLGTPRSQRMDPFFQIDARVDKRLVFRNWILSAYFDVQNMNYFLYNSPETYMYNYDDSERQVVGSIIIPAIGLRAEF
jgi:outer membrane receptor protein involved in Fe transport